MQIETRLLDVRMNRSATPLALGFAHVRGRNRAPEPEPLHLTTCAAPPAGNFGRAGISRSVTMQLTGHETEIVDRCYAIVAERDLREAGTKLAAALAQARRHRSLSDNLSDSVLQWLKIWWA